MFFMIYVLSLIVFLLDRLSKWWVTVSLAHGETVQFHELLRLQATYNRGMVFGLLQGTASWMGWLSILVIGGLILYLARLPKAASLMRLGLALVIGGALGNLVDRLLYGQVLDFISSPLLPWVFNVADIFINGGIVMFAAGSLFYHPQDEAAVPDSPSAP